MRGSVNEISLPQRRLAWNEEIAKTAAGCSSTPSNRRPRLRPAVSAAFVIIAAVIFVAGCSSGTSTSHVGIGAITFTNVNGTPQAKPLTSLTAGQSTYVDITLSNDPQNLGADWSVYCGSAPPPGTPPPPGQTQSDVCGTFTPVHTMSGPIPTYVTSGAGYVALYTAPATPPANGNVTLYAAATSNPSRWTSVSLTVVGLPISVGFAPAPPSTLATGATTQLKAVVNNDAANGGVSWTTICASSDCGSFTPGQTASGVTTTYAAPATLPEGGTVQLIATSVTDPTKSASASVTITAAPASALSGSVRVSLQPVVASHVTLYAGITQASSSTAVAAKTENSALAEAITDEDGNFTFPDGYRCPTPESQLYLIATGGSVRAGSNPNLALVTALGPCSQLGSLRVTVNEATTVATVYALSGFIVDARRIGSKDTPPNALAAAFATAKDLVNLATGVARTHTVSGAGIVPQARINTLANLVSACARTAGSTPGDGGPCDQFFAAANHGSGEATRPTDTLQALLNLARNVSNLHEKPGALATLFTLACEQDSFQPALSLQPEDWTLAVIFPAIDAKGTGARVPAMESRNTFVDAAGNLWYEGGNGSRVELIGGAFSLGAPKALLPIAAEIETAP